MLKQSIPPENRGREGGGLCDGGLQLTGGENDTAAPTSPACTMASVGLGKGQDSHSSLDALSNIFQTSIYVWQEWHMQIAESPIQYQ